MLDRCNVSTHKSYKDYGERGIKVCARWSKFENFFADMGEAPQGLSIDRIDTNGNYEPSNCRWADSFQQGRNKNNNLLVTAFGKTQCVAAWMEEKGISRETISYRMRCGLSGEDLFVSKYISRKRIKSAA